MQREEIETNELPEQYVLNDYSDIVCSTIDIVNICFVGEPQQPNNDWVLIDAGLPKSGPRILRELEERFGENTNTPTRPHAESRLIAGPLEPRVEVAVHADIRERLEPPVPGQ